MTESETSENIESSSGDGTKTPERRLGHPPRKWSDDLPLWIMIALFIGVVSFVSIVWYQRLP